MPFDPNPQLVYADGPVNDPYEPNKADIRKIWQQVEQAIDAYTSGAGTIAKQTITQLNADLAHAADTTAWVYNDPNVANNGIYRKLGASGVGSWVRILPLPFSFIIATNLGAGSPNAILATTSIPVSNAALIILNIAEDYSGTSATVSFNNGAPLTIKSNSGADVLRLTSGQMLLGVISGTTFRLASDEAIAALIYGARDQAIAARDAAEQYRDESEAARDIAAGYASDAVSQGNVPIYATLAGLGAVEIPVGINGIRVNGRNAAGDGEGGLYVDTDNGSSDTGVSGGATARTWYRAEDVSGTRFTSDVFEILTPLGDSIQSLGGNSGTVGAINVKRFSASISDAGGLFRWNSSRVRADHDGLNVISPTVPTWDDALANLPAYLTGEDDTAPSSTGVWERIGLPYRSPNARYREILSRLAGGASIEIACFGDSTTEGLGSSAWVARSGDPATYNPVTAYPAQLQQLLRDMTGAASVTTHNCGWSGRAVVDQWAINNYKMAVLDPFGAPDLVIVAFGINDRGIAGYTRDKFYRELLRLCSLILLTGSVPLIMSTDIQVHNSQVRSDYSLGTEVREVQLAVADALDLPFFDMHKGLSNFFRNNSDWLGGWLQRQLDQTHGDDHFYAAKASLLAVEFLPERVMRVDSSRTWIAPWASQSKPVNRSGNLGTYPDSNTQIGGNGLFPPASYAVGDRIIDTWVWNDGLPDGAIAYRGLISNDEISTTSANWSDILVDARSYYNLPITSKKPLNSGFAGGAEFCQTDRPQIVSGLPKGLVRASFRVNQVLAAARVAGHFEFIPQFEWAGGNVKLTTPIPDRVSIIPVAPSSFKVQHVLVDKAYNNLIQFGPSSGQASGFYTEIYWPKETGIVILDGPGMYFPGSPHTGISPKGDDYRVGCVIFRANDDTMRIMRMAHSVRTDQVWVETLATGAPLGWTTDDQAIEISLWQDAPSGQHIEVKQGIAGPNLVSATIPRSQVALPISGSIGGVIAGTANASTLFRLKIPRLTVVI